MRGMRKALGEAIFADMRTLSKRPSTRLHVLLLSLTWIPFPSPSFLLYTFRICNVRILMLSFISPSSLLSICSLLSLSKSGTASILFLRRSFNKIEVNSTCAIFWPGQTRGPVDHGTNVPFGGEKSVPWASSQREGRNTNSSFEQGDSGGWRLRFRQTSGLRWVATVLT